MTYAQYQQLKPEDFKREMFRRFGNPDDPNDAVVQTFTHHIPTKRLGESAEVAEAVIWLCSNASAYITGHNQIIASLIRRRIVAKRLGDKVAIITGASKGIGEAIAKLYAEEGAKVLAVFHSDEAAAHKILDEIKAVGGEVALFQGDVSKKADAERIAEEAMRLYGKIDVLCSNAGIYPSAKIEDMTEEDWDKVHSVNLKGTFLSVKACLPQMQAQSYGKVVTIASTTGVRTGIPGYSHYGATKAGIIGFIRCACMELAQHNITINAVAPGLVLTEEVKGMLGDDTETFIKEVEKEIPLKRAADPIDIAYATLFLSTDESRYITGQEIVVDGGLILPELPLQLLG